MKKSLIILGSFFVALGTMAKPDEKAEGKPEFKSGLVAHYYMDPTNWGGNWPDSISKPEVKAVDWTFREYKYSRVEPLVNHRFVHKGWFSVRWSGYFDPSGRESFVEDKKGSEKKSEGGKSEEHEYIFEILADDGCRLLIDGKVVIDDWRPCSEAAPDALRKSAPVKLADGKHAIIVEYFQGQSLKNYDQDPISLYWSSTSAKVPRQIIPASHFYHSAADAEKPDRK